MGKKKSNKPRGARKKKEKRRAHLEPNAPAPASSSFIVGTRVEARYFGMDTYYPGVIVAVNGDNTFGIKYDDGNDEAMAPSDMIRAVTVIAEAPTEER